MASFEYVHKYFDPFLSVNPERYDKVMVALGDAKVALKDSDIGLVTEVQGDVEEWEGASADTLNGTVLSRLTARRDNQVELIDELIVAAAANREIAVKTQKDIIAIALGTEAALEGLEGDGCCDKDTLTKVLGIFGALVAAISGIGAICSAAGMAAAATKIGVGAAGLGLVNAVSGAGNNFIAADEKATIKGKTPKEVLESTHDAITKLHKGIDDQENQLKKVLEKDAGLLKTGELEVPDIKLAAANFRP